MDPLSGIYADTLFSAIPRQKAQLDNLSGAALTSGIDLYMNGNYDGAIREFTRAIGLSPYSENSLYAHEYLANAYLELNRTEDAINSYKRSLRLFPLQDDTHVKLGNLYFSLERFGDAEMEYKEAVRLNPQSSDNIYSLGQAYLATGHYQEAESQFEKVIRMAPAHNSGYYALGQTYSKKGQYEDAIEQFHNTLDIDRNFEYAYLDLGYAYADMNDVDQAEKQVDILENLNSPLAVVLREYIYKVENPGFVGVYNTSGFYTSFGPGTPLTTLDDSFSNPNASKEYTMKFIFNKDMDAASVQNPYNWRISRASGENIGGAYNWGLLIPSTEVELSLFPQRVVYDPDSHTAEVSFTLKQNDLADGTIDPSHIVFQFCGKDTYGNTMDSNADEYSGISKIV